MLESSLVEQIRASLATRGIWSFKVHGSPNQEKGIPDLIGVIPPGGRAFGIEVKVPGHASKARCADGTCAEKLQLYQLERMANAGAIVGIAHSVEDAWLILGETDGRPFTGNIRPRSPDL